MHFGFNLDSFLNAFCVVFWVSFFVRLRAKKGPSSGPVMAVGWPRGGSNGHAFLYILEINEQTAREWCSFVKMQFGTVP